jgi:hypothetical protein
MDAPTLFISTPTGGHPHWRFTHSLVQLVQYCQQTPVIEPGEQIHFNMIASSYICQNRKLLVDIALANGGQYVLFIDHDIEFPRDTLHRLLSRSKPVISANYRLRGPNGQFIALSPNCRRRVRTQTDSSGVERCFHSGFGCTLISCQVFRKVPQPWFLIEYDRLGFYTGEDHFFGRRLTEAGIPWYVDHDLSKLVSHWGEIGYGYNTQIVQPLETDLLKKMMVTPNGK